MEKTATRYDDFDFLTFISDFKVIDQFVIMSTDRTFVAHGHMILPYNAHCPTINSLGGDRFGAKCSFLTFFGPSGAPEEAAIEKRRKIVLDNYLMYL